MSIELSYWLFPYLTPSSVANIIIFIPIFWFFHNLFKAFFLKPCFPDLLVPLPCFFLYFFFSTNYYVGYCIKNWYYSQWVFQLLVSNRFFSSASTFTLFFYIFFISTSSRLRKKEEDICVGTLTKVITVSKLKSTCQKQTYCHISADISAETEPKPEKFGI